MLKTIAANPFALMINPESVLQAIECSERLARLHSRVCRPLDKPLIPKQGDEASMFDQQIDSEPEVQ